MTPRPGQILIVGGGLAGSVLAWLLEKRGFQPTVVDDRRPGAAHAAGAGLFQTCSGRRGAPLPGARKLSRIAVAVFREMERDFQTKIFHSMPICREFATREIRENWEHNRVQRLSAGGKEESFAEGIVTFGGGWVDFPRIVESVKASGISWIEHTMQFSELRFHGFEDPVAREAEVCGWEWQGIRYEAVVFCGGYRPELDTAMEHPEWVPASGDVLEVAIEGWDASCIRVREFFTVPLGGNRFLAGSTYDPEDWSGLPNALRAETILAGLVQWTGRDVQLLRHKAGVRPTLAGRVPVAGRLPHLPRAFAINGLGSRGALHAPAAALRVLWELMGKEGTGIPGFQEPGRKPPHRLTALAHRLCEPFLHPGAIAVDGTAGNGRDTLLLALAVGGEGKVFAGDIQSSALENTKAVLVEAGCLERSTLIAGNHDRLVEALPRELRGAVAVAMMNLGYLPSGDLQIVTRLESTIRFLDFLLPWLAPRAAISVLSYRGHPGGAEEHAGVLRWMLERGNQGWKLLRRPSPTPSGPELFFLSREGYSWSASAERNVRGGE